MSTCTNQSHELLKLQPERWAELEYIGFLESDPGDPIVELRNCSCGSTLGREMPPRSGS